MGRVNVKHRCSSVLWNSFVFATLKTCFPFPCLSPGSLYHPLINISSCHPGARQKCPGGQVLPTWLNSPLYLGENVAFSLKIERKVFCLVSLESLCSSPTSGPVSKQVSGLFQNASPLLYLEWGGTITSQPCSPGAIESHLATI